MPQKDLTKDRILSDITKAYLVANTPAYLLKTLAESVPVRELARSNTLTKLASLYKRHAAKKHRSLEDVALAYAALVAITLKERSGAKAAIEELDTSLLDWAESIKDRFVAASPKMLTVRIQAAPETTMTYTQTTPSAIQFHKPNGISP
jgi:hypothetical protein